MAGDYRVSVFRCGDRLSETTCTDWAHCLCVVAMTARGNTDDVVVFDADKYDYSIDCGVYDGLTDEQREAVGETIDRARGGAVSL